MPIRNVLAGQGVSPGKWLKLHITPRIAIFIGAPVLERIDHGVEGDPPAALLTIVRADQAAVFLFKEDFFALRALLHGRVILLRDPLDQEQQKMHQSFGRKSFL
jgi:hypothetical protein